MARDLKNVYFVKNTAGGSWVDVTTRFNGLRILKVDGFNSFGKPVNIYTAQWIDSQVEDFVITKEVNSSPVVIRENTDLEITFIIRQKYANSTIDVQSVHDAFISYMTGTDVWVKSAYVGNKYVHCVCLKEYKPTTVKLQRGTESWIMGTLTLHCLEAPHGYTPTTYNVVQNPTGNPNAQGYYEREGSTDNYRITWDMSVVSGKTYYTSAL